MHDLIVYITSCGPNVKNPAYWNNLFETIASLSQTIGDIDYKFYIVVDYEPLKSAVEGIFSHPRFEKIIKQDALLDVKLSTDSWASCYNSFFEEYKDSTQYILISHDDIIVQTPNFITHTLDLLKDKTDPIGWVSFTNNKYQQVNRMPIANSFKDPFALDRDMHPRLFECHRYPKDSTISNENESMLDYPSGPVKTYGPYTHLVLVSTESMEKIGPCADWTDYTIFIDDDWNMAALEAKLWNVWVPDVFYAHPNPKYNYLRQPGTDLRFVKEASEEFFRKWGWKYSDDGSELSDEAIESIRQRYKDTFIPASSYKNTYDWEYLK
tara:strand:+ start:10459 stop:11430 length:972 start_codon:yes stop_codon:yes gene_type:complete